VEGLILQIFGVSRAELFGVDSDVHQNFPRRDVQLLRVAAAKILCVVGGIEWRLVGHPASIIDQS